MSKKTAILLINLGTPESPKVSDVRKYLTQFLNDPRVIDMPWLKRKLLVNGLIVPLRAPKSAKEYQKLFDASNGRSPLLAHGIKLKNDLQNLYTKEDNVIVDLAMRYGNPSIPSVMGRLKKQNVDSIVVLPLYPHYAASSTGTVMEEVMRVASKWWAIPEIKFVGQFFNRPEFIDAFVEVSKKYNHQDYDHVLFSYHGLPVRHLDKTYNNDGLCSDHDCENEIPEGGNFCYKAACYETTRQLVKKLNLSEGKYSSSFQSRLGRDPWIQPYSDFVLKDLAEAGKKKVLVFSPAFVADCLETVVEIGMEYNEDFIENGGEKIQLVESLNTNPVWVKGLKNILNDYV